VDDLRQHGHDVVLTAREHGETVGLALRHWHDVVVVGGQSPSQLGPKITAITGRAHRLASLLRSERADLAFSHGSYAQALAAARLRIPLVTMMDYEYQPANHLSFRLARRVIVPTSFPTSRLRKCGAGLSKVIRYEGFKEELYLAGFRPEPAIVETLGLDRKRVIAVFREPPRGALYHPPENRHFEEIVDAAARNPNVQSVLLPRGENGSSRYRGRRGLAIPTRPVDAHSLLAAADLMIGGGGTMTRESALLGTPTYTVFIGRLAAVDRELIRLGLLRDLRDRGLPTFVKRTGPPRVVSEARRREILRAIGEALVEVS
jgi:predicted glycosyltransferase